MEQKSLCPAVGMFSPQCKTLLHILLSVSVFALAKNSVQNQYKPLHTVDLKPMPRLQEDDHHSEVPVISTNKARALPSEMNFVVLDQMAVCDITMPNLLFANSSNPGLQFLDRWPQAITRVVISKGQREGFTERITLWVLHGAPQGLLMCALHWPHCPSVRANAPGYTALWASQELTTIRKGKLIAFSVAGYTRQVLSDHLPIQCSVSIMLCCWSFFSPTPQKSPILEWPSDERLTMTLLVVEYTWKCTVQTADIGILVLRLGFIQCFPPWKVWGAEMVPYDTSWVSHTFQQ